MPMPSPSNSFLARNRAGREPTETISVHGRPVALHLTPAARRALAHRAEPLTVELELFFSCLIRTRVRFPATGDAEDAEDGEVLAANGRLRLRFRPVMSRHCSLAEGHQLNGFPLAEPQPFVPHWVRLDYRAGTGWTGAFGYGTGQAQEAAA
ncbi:hypothetical protein [Thiohalorhabdus sp.]|uniref:hypothetical protein n=1 Tax=Thiohalorhabdus sp. TaxID=3094134 RepID=UPI002FC323A8